MESDYDYDYEIDYEHEHEHEMPILVVSEMSVYRKLLRPLRQERFGCGAKVVEERNEFGQLAEAVAKA